MQERMGGERGGIGGERGWNWRRDERMGRERGGIGGERKGWEERTGERKGEF